jgi:hypothetical protein
VKVFVRELVFFCSKPNHRVTPLYHSRNEEMSPPEITDQSVVTGTNGFDNLQLQKDIPIPEFGEHDALVQIQAMSLDYRDLIMPRVIQSLQPKKHITGPLIARIPFPNEITSSGLLRRCWQGAGSRQGGDSAPEAAVRGLEQWKKVRFSS